MKGINPALEAQLRERISQSHTELQKYGFFARPTTYQDYQNRLGNDTAFLAVLDAFNIPESDLDKSHSNATDSSINSALEILVETEEYKNDPLSPIVIDQSLLCIDLLRTWQYKYKPRSVEKEGGKAYTDILKQLTLISNGVFAPTNVTESWSEDFVDVDLQFQTNDDIWLVKISNSSEGYRYKRNITTIVNSANQALNGQDIKFYRIKTFNNVLCVVALSTSNKTLLETERHWEFA